MYLLDRIKQNLCDRHDDPSVFQHIGLQANAKQYKDLDKAETDMICLPRDIKEYFFVLFSIIYQYLFIHTKTVYCTFGVFAFICL